MLERFTGPFTGYASRLLIGIAMELAPPQVKHELSLLKVAILQNENSEKREPDRRLRALPNYP
jgi:hypothetical protein